MDHSTGLLSPPVCSLLLPQASFLLSRSVAGSLPGLLGWKLTSPQGRKEVCRQGQAQHLNFSGLEDSDAGRLGAWNGGQNKGTATLRLPAEGWEDGVQLSPPSTSTLYWLSCSGSRAAGGPSRGGGGSCFSPSIAF